MDSLRLKVLNASAPMPEILEMSLCEDLKKPTYIKGLQCESCVNKYTDSDRARFAERQRQIDEVMKRLPENSIWPSS